MKQALAICVILGVATSALCRDVPPLGTVQRDYRLDVECPVGWELLYLDSDQANPICIWLNMDDAVSTVEVAKARCELEQSWLAEPEGWLHQEIYQRILDRGYDQAAFWIGGSDQAAEGTWIWERTGKTMPMGTPHWEHCSPSQPLPNDRNSNYACIWPGDYYFFSCTNGISIRTMCQKYATPVTSTTVNILDQGQQ